MDTLSSTIIEFDLSELVCKQITLEELSLGSYRPHKIYWIHCNLNDREFFNKLSKDLPLPAPVIKLCEEQEESMIPKLIEESDLLAVRVQCLLSDKLNAVQEIDFGNLIIHLSERYCFTAAFDSIPALLEFLESHPKAVRYAKTPCFILFLLLDNTINDYAKILLEFELKADQIDLSIHDIHENIYHEVMELKRKITKTKRYAITIRDILMRISGRKIAVISEQCRTSLDNLFNHSQMIVHESDSIREILNSSLDQIDNALMQKMNNTMKILTSFAAIFLPLSLIASIYGMNFDWMPELHWQYGYFFALALMLGCGIGLLTLFKKMKWF